MSLTDEERTMLAEVAQDAAYRNAERDYELKMMRYRLIGWFIAGIAVIIFVAVTLIMDKK